MRWMTTLPGKYIRERGVGGGLGREKQALALCPSKKRVRVNLTSRHNIKQSKWGVRKEGKGLSKKNRVLGKLIIKKENTPRQSRRPCRRGDEPGERPGGAGRGPKKEEGREPAAALGNKGTVKAINASMGTHSSEIKGKLRVISSRQREEKSKRAYLTFYFPFFSPGVFGKKRMQRGRGGKKWQSLSKKKEGKRGRAWGSAKIVVTKQQR